MGNSGVVARDELVSSLDGLLDAQLTSDFGPNGLQVEGREEIRRLVTGVSSCQELFRAARLRSADAVVVHHDSLGLLARWTTRVVQRATGVASRGWPN